MSKSPNLNQAFDAKNNPNLTERVAEVASKQQYLGIGDTDHGCVEIHETISSRPFMEGLARGGIKHLCMETFGSLSETIFQSYRDGKISDDDLQVIGQEFFAISMEDDFGVDPTRSRQSIINYMKHAKEFGIDLHKINNWEGVYTEEENEMIVKSNFLSAKAILSIVKNDSGYKETPEGDRQEYLRDKFNEVIDLDPENEEIHRKCIFMMEARDAQLEFEVAAYQDEGLNSIEAANRVIYDIVVARFDKDKDVAERIKERFGDEKVAVVYGIHHFLRSSGDIDYYFNNMPVINIYADEQQQQKSLPLEERISKLMGVPLENAEYSYNIARNTWQTGNNPPVQLSGSENQQQDVAAPRIDPVDPVQYGLMNK